MKTTKIGFVLLALLLAAMAIVPLVSAADEIMDKKSLEILDTANAVSAHHVYPDYYRNAKLMEPLPESEMVTVVISQKTLGISGTEKKPEIISVSPSMLDARSSDLQILDIPEIRYEKILDQNAGVVLVRIPKTMYDVFVSSSQGKNLELPTKSFCRFYDSISDMKAHMKKTGDRLEFTSDQNDISTDLRQVSLPKVKETPVIPQMTAKTLGTDNWFIERVHFNRISPGTSYDYSMGQIRPEYAYFSGTQDQFWIPQEREYYLNNQDAIEVVVNYDHIVYPAGGVVLFPQIWDNGALVDLSQYENLGAGIIPLNPSTFPHAYGYHVMLSGTRYYVGFIDMNTASWYPIYVYNDADNPSTSFDLLKGSSEYNQFTQPIHDQFVAWTDPVTEEWVRERVTGTWKTPSQVWQPAIPSQDPNVRFVHIGYGWSGSNLVTYSYADFRWA